MKKRTLKVELDHYYQQANDYRELIDQVQKFIEEYLLPLLAFAMEMTRNGTTYDLAKFMKEMLETLMAGIREDIERIAQDKYQVECKDE